jgi:hypothetical protein
MTIDKWLETKALIEAKFEIEEEGDYYSEEYGGTKTEYLVFESRLGKIKLEFVSKPQVIDKIVNYSNRIGSDVSIDYQYSPTEKKYQMLVYRWSDDNDSWLPVSSENNFF